FLSRAGVIDGFPRERFECGPWAGPAGACRASLDARYGLLRRVGTIERCRLAHLLRRLRDETDSHAFVDRAAVRNVARRRAAPGPEDRMAATNGCRACRRCWRDWCRAPPAESTWLRLAG